MKWLGFALAFTAFTAFKFDRPTGDVRSFILESGQYTDWVQFAGRFGAEGTFLVQRLSWSRHGHGKTGNHSFIAVICSRSAAICEAFLKKLSPKRIIAPVQ